MKKQTNLKFIILAIFLFIVVFVPNKVLATKYGDLTYHIDSSTKELAITDCDENVTKVNIPNKINGYIVTKIDFAAFKDCTKLTNITIPNGIMEIANNAFENCSSLTNISIPATVKSIEDSCFKDCIKLEKITLTKNLETIGSNAFMGCINLKNFTIPNGVKKIYSGAFRDCAKLTNIVVPKSVTYCANAFDSCTGLVSLTINAQITSIDGCNNCPNLKKVKLPDGIQYIEAYAFADCTSLEEITLPSSVCQVKLGAFRNCKSLKKVTFLGKDTSFDGTYIFSETPSNMVLYVIRGSKAEALAINGDYNNDGFNYRYIGVLKKVNNLKAKTQTTNSITLNWSKVSDANGYQIQRYNSSKRQWVNVATTANTSYKVSKLDAGKTYKYRVRAFKTIDGYRMYGSYSTTLNTATKTVAPKISKITTGGKKANLQWKKVSGANGYEVYMKASKKAKYKKIKTISKSNITKYTKTKLNKGKYYYFKIRTYKKVNGKTVYSSYSNVKSIKVK